MKSDRTIQLSDQLLGSEPMHYVCRIKDDQGSRLLNPGTKLLAYLNPFRTERLCVCAEDGSYIGTLQQRDRAGWLDQDAILEQLKERAEIKADLDTGVKPLLQGLMDARTAMKANNARLKAGKPVLPEEIAAARVAAAQQGQRTAAANRLNEHGDDREWQTVDAASGEDETWQDPFASLPEGEDFPDSI